MRFLPQDVQVCVHADVLSQDLPESPSATDDEVLSWTSRESKVTQTVVDDSGQTPATIDPQEARLEQLLQEQLQQEGRLEEDAEEQQEQRRQ